MSGKQERELQDTAQRLVSLLQSVLSEPAPRNNLENQHHNGGQGVLQQACSTVEQNMARSFPALFRQKIPGKKRPNVFSSNIKRGHNIKTFAIQFYLVNKYMEKTPKAGDELKLLQAGIGRRTINVTEDADHLWLSRKLEETFTKIATLKGAWMLYKAVGGSGQRKLCIVPPEAEGYTGPYLNTVASGKSALYIVPVQGSLDTTPLPYSAKEFEKMPKATCHTCSVNMPVQLLAAHVTSCEREQFSDVTDKQTTDFLGSPENTDTIQENSPDDYTEIDMSLTDSTDLPSSSNVPNVKIACPICQQLYSTEYVEVHASFCGERASKPIILVSDDDTDGTEKSPKRRRHQETKSFADVIQSIAKKVDESTVFNICITRDQMLDRGMKQWQRQKKSSPKNPLRVSFIGEAGIDSGALRKEFLTEMLAGIERRFFEGGISGKVPKYSMTDFEKYNFKTVGEIFAVSLAQGGPPPNFLMQWCYEFISTGELDQESITEKDVADPDLMELIKEIEAAGNETLMECTDRILSCGYTGPVSLHRKEDIVRSVVLHSAVRLVPMLQQISSGMKLYDLLSLVQQEKDICRQLFVPGSFCKVDADFLVKSLSPVFSEMGTMRHQRESTVVNFMQDFVQDMEDEAEDENNREDMPEETMGENENVDEAEKQKHTHVGKFCQWLTGQSHIPLSQAEREEFKIVMEFDHDCQVRYGENHTICYPVVNACSRSVTFPVAHLNTYVQFKTVLSQAIVHGYEFGRW